MSNLHKKDDAWWRTTQQTILKQLCQNTCNKTAIKANFHFSHYKSMQILSCHSNQNAFAQAIKTMEEHSTNISEVLFDRDKNNIFVPLPVDALCEIW